MRTFKLWADGDAYVGTDLATCSIAVVLRMRSCRPNGAVPVAKKCELKPPFLLQNIPGNRVGRSVHGNDDESDSGREIAADVQVGDVNRLVVMGVGLYLIDLESVVVAHRRQGQRRKALQDRIVGGAADFFDYVIDLHHLVPFGRFQLDPSILGDLRHVRCDTRCWSRGERLSRIAAMRW